MKELGGNSLVITSDPEIKFFEITQEHDFIILGTDGIFDKLKNQEVIDCVWNSLKDEPTKDVDLKCCKGIETIIKNALLRKTSDNVSVLMICFKNFDQEIINGQISTQINNTKHLKGIMLNEKQNSFKPSIEQQKTKLTFFRNQANQLQKNKKMI